jgi:HK97 family phage prohead protease
MPIPKPTSDESRQNFLKRCMGDDTMTSEYTDTDQRLAVCTNEYDSNKEDSIENDEKHIRAVEETDDSYIIEFGKSKPDTEETVDEMNSEKEVEKESIEIKSSIKAYQDEDEDKNYGTFEGYGSVFGNKDLGNDVIEAGAFAKSLKKRKPQNVKLLYQHKSDMPIGVFDEIKEDEHGLVVKGRLALKTQAGAEAYELLKMGALDGLSIGFRVNPKEVSYDKRGNKRIIKEVDLMEVSLVTFPMNPQATVRSVKGEEISIREWENGLRDAFSLSRSEAKVAAKAVTKCFDQREVDESAELVDAIKELTLTLKT